jgi:hypothetical protein
MLIKSYQKTLSRSHSKQIVILSKLNSKLKKNYLNNKEMTMRGLENYFLTFRCSTQFFL